MQRGGRLHLYRNESIAHDRHRSPQPSGATNGAVPAPGCGRGIPMTLDLRDIVVDERTLRVSVETPRGRKPTEISCAGVDVPSLEVCPDGVGKGPKRSGYWTEVTRYWEWSGRTRGRCERTRDEPSPDVYFPSAVDLCGGTQWTGMGVGVKWDPRKRLGILCIISFGWKHRQRCSWVCLAGRRCPPSLPSLVPESAYPRIAG